MHLDKAQSDLKTHVIANHGGTILIAIGLIISVVIICYCTNRKVSKTKQSFELKLLNKNQENLNDSDDN